MKTEDLSWIAGLLEGEGSFSLAYKKSPYNEYYYPRIVISMTDEDVIQRAAIIMGAKQVYVKIKLCKKTLYTTTIYGAKAIALMRIILPFMGIRRASKINEIISTWEIISKRPDKRKTRQQQLQKLLEVQEALKQQEAR